MTFDEWSQITWRELEAAGFAVTFVGGFPLVKRSADREDIMRLLQLELSVRAVRHIEGNGMLFMPRTYHPHDPRPRHSPGNYPLVVPGELVKVITLTLARVPAATTSATPRAIRAQVNCVWSAAAMMNGSFLLAFLHRIHLRNRLIPDRGALAFSASRHGRYRRIASKLTEMEVVVRTPHIGRWLRQTCRKQLVRDEAHMRCAFRALQQDASSSSIDAQSTPCVARHPSHAFQCLELIVNRRHRHCLLRRRSEADRYSPISPCRRLDATLINRAHSEYSQSSWCLSLLYPHRAAARVHRRLRVVVARASTIVITPVSDRSPANRVPGSHASPQGTSITLTS